MEINEEQSQQAVYIASLIFRVQENDPLTDQETEDLRKWLSSGNQAGSLMDSLGDRHEMARKVQEFSRFDSDGATREIFQKLEMGHGQESGRLVFRRNWITVAAACMLVLGGTWAYLTRTKSPSTSRSETAVTSTSEVRPGSGNKATLTLGDGKKIALDSVQNGASFQQGNSHISKSKGQLIYSQGIPSAGDAPVSYNTISTPKGGQYKVILPDGSRVWLNAASSLTYPTVFQGDARAVVMTGEAYFEVATHKGKPFIVRAGGADIMALGTHFNIMDYPDEDHLCATLLEGQVQVKEGRVARMLLPGQEALVSSNNVGSSSSTIRVEEADVEQSVAWTTGFFEFEGADIRTVMREISRWYDIEVIFSNVDYTGKYGGRISMNQNLSAVLAFLEGNGIHHYQLEGRKITVLP